MTKLNRTVAAGEALEPRCRWCRRPIPSHDGPGRPRQFCSQRCRQWDWVARQCAGELELAEGELVMARSDLDELGDRIYVLSCAVDDAHQDLSAGNHTVESVREILDWVLEAARAVISTTVSPSSTDSP